MSFDHVVERVSARRASDEEAELLGLVADEPVLSVLLVAYEATGCALQVVDLVLPSGRHELEDRYSLN